MALPVPVLVVRVGGNHAMRSMGFSVGGYVCMQGDTKAAATFVSNC